MTSLVGLDVGTSGVKALKLSPTGEVLVKAEEIYLLATPEPGWVEQDPEDWWRAAEAVLDRLGGEEAAAIGLSGQMHGLVVLDDEDRVLRPAILWNDQRTELECTEIEGLSACGSSSGSPETGRCRGSRRPSSSGFADTSPRCTRASPMCSCRRTTCACA
jgi:sugar (pentulose or hexulose) kinase